MNFVMLGALGLALAAPTLATAAAGDPSTAVAVRYGDLDLNRTSDARVLLDRIKDAALDACGADRSSLREYRFAVQRSACYRAGVTHAVAELGAPAVTNLLQTGRAHVTISGE
jgi:UrcA family protein